MDFKSEYWINLKKRVDEKMAFEKPFEMTMEQYRDIKKTLSLVMLEQELLEISDGLENCEELLKSFNLLPTMNNICSISLAADQILQEQYGYLPQEDRF